MQHQHQIILHHGVFRDVKHFPAPPAGGMVGEYRREQGCQAYREYVKTGLARRDEELEQALSLEQIAQQVGLKEGSRVSHCHTELDQMLRQDATLQRQYEQMQALLRGS